MSTTTELDRPDAPADEKLRAIAARVAAAARLAAEKATAHTADRARFPMPADPDALEHLFLSRFAKLSPKKQEEARSRVRASIAAPQAERARELGDLVAVRLDRPEAIMRQVGAMPIPAALKIPPAAMKSLATSTIAPVALAASAAAARHTRLLFRLHHVKCVDETGGSFRESFGNDEISLGGSVVDVTGGAAPIKAFRVGSSFDDGDIKTFNPLKILSVFDLERGKDFPKMATVVLLLAEVDMGDLPDFVTKLVDKLKAELAKGIAEAGSTATASGPLTNEIIRRAADFVLSKIIGFLIRAWEDDLFPPVTLTMSIPRLTHIFSNGKTNSPDQIVSFKGHGDDMS